MIRNKWLIMCLLIGSILSIAMVSSIPAYSDAVFQRMLTRNLENYQLQNNIYPGQFTVRAEISDGFKEEQRVNAYLQFDGIIKEYQEQYGIPSVAQSTRINLLSANLVPEGTEDAKKVNRYVKIEALSDIGNHIEIIHGKMHSSEMTDGIIEVIATEQALKKNNLLLNQVYTISGSSFEKAYSQTIKGDLPKIKIVGVFTMSSNTDPYWYKGIDPYESSVIMDYDLFQKMFIESKSPAVSSAEWYYAMDYYKFTIDNIESIINRYNEQVEFFKSKYPRSITMDMPVVNGVLTNYGNKKESLRLTLMILQVPILIMLAFYIFMVSQLLIEHEKNEIAVFKSRGASKLQIFRKYLLESSILSVISLIIGPPLGLMICKVIGASNGFMEFVQRAGLKVHLSSKVYLYALVAAVLLIVTMLLPAIAASKIDIVIYKQSKAKANKRTFWKKFYLDFVMLAIAIYGWYTYSKQQKMISETNLKASDLGLDPILFVICTCFIIGTGLLFLRIYPLIIKFVFWLGRKIWSPVFYASFIQVGRSSGKEQFIMLFIVLTLSIGIFSANTARTMNTNIEDRIRYMNGADIVIEPDWNGNNYPSSTPRTDYVDAFGTYTRFSPVANEDGVATILPFIEPPFSPYAELKGIEAATKVYVNRDPANASLKPGNSPWINSGVHVMGVIPEEFGRIAWMRDDLTYQHWYYYLNLLAESPKAVLVSTSLRDKYNLKVGDTVYIGLKAQGESLGENLEGVIYGFIDYWPGFNAKMVKQVTQGTEVEYQYPYLVVANFNYLYENFSLHPYEIWLKKSEDATLAEIYADIEAKGLEPVKILETVSQITEKKNDPALQGTNGSLTLGFIVTLMICTIGFIIYWVLSIKERVLQFGILRAMGLTFKKLLGMLICEQALISGVAIFIGIIMGGVASDLFTPLLQITDSSATQILPYEIIKLPQDYLKVYSFAGIMLLSGLAVLGILVSRININQALKLGED